MKLSYSIFFSLFTILGFSQDLSITGDNFLYSNNTVIYVNNGINLGDAQTDLDYSSKIAPSKEAVRLWTRGGATALITAVKKTLRYSNVFFSTLLLCGSSVVYFRGPQ